MNYTSNTIWLLSEKIFRLIITLLVTIWLARYLGPQQFGLLSYSQSFIMIFAVFVGLGMDSVLVKELVKNQKFIDIYLGTAFRLKIISAFISILLIAMIVIFTSHDPVVRTLIFIISTSIIFQTINVIDYYFQSQVLSKYIVFINTFCLSVSSIIKVLLIIYNSPLIFFVIAIVLDNLIIAIGYIYIYYFKNHRIFLWEYDKTIAKILIINSWPLLFAGIGYTLYRRIDQIMIYNMLNEIDVGLYSAAVKAIDILHIIPLVIINSIFPYLVEIYDDEELFSNIILSLYRIMACLSLIIMVLLYLFNDTIILQLYGVSYKGSIAPYTILIAGIIFDSYARINGKWIVLKNCQMISLYRTIFGCIINILLNLIFIPRYGIIGAAYSTIITLFLAVIIYYLFHKESREIFFTQLRAFTTFYKLQSISFYFRGK